MAPCLARLLGGTGRCMPQWLPFLAKLLGGTGWDVPKWLPV